MRDRSRRLLPTISAPQSGALRETPRAGGPRHHPRGATPCGKCRAGVAELSRAQSREEEVVPQRPTFSSREQADPGPRGLRAAATRRRTGRDRRGRPPGAWPRRSSPCAPRSGNGWRSEWRKADRVGYVAGRASMHYRGHRAGEPLADASRDAASSRRPSSSPRRSHDATGPPSGMGGPGDPRALPARASPRRRSPRARRERVDAREDLERELLAGQPFDGAKAAFEKQRVGYGLGGVAAGSRSRHPHRARHRHGRRRRVLAPSLRPVEGEPIRLKQGCLAKIDACLNEAESHARAQLQGKRASLSPRDRRRYRRGRRGIAAPRSTTPSGGS